MEYEQIELIDAGNCGRSLIAEAFAKRSLERRGLLGTGGVVVDSSGTLVNAAKNVSGGELIKLVEPYFPTAIKAGFLSPEDVEAIQRGEVEAIRKLRGKINSGKRDEKSRVRGILTERGLFEYFGDRRINHPIQTKARHSGLILAMTVKDCERAERIYAGSHLNPTITPLTAYAGNDIWIGLDIADPFFMDRQGHREVAAQIEYATVLAMEKALS